MGPPLRKVPFMSDGFMKRLMHGTMASVSGEHCSVVDVRDVAFAHLQAVKVPEAANRRFILVHSSPSMQEYAEPVIRKYAPLGWPITRNKTTPNHKEYVSLFDNRASREILGVTYTDFAKTMLDMAE